MRPCAAAPVQACKTTRTCLLHVHLQGKQGTPNNTEIGIRIVRFVLRRRKEVAKPLVWSCANVAARAAEAARAATQKTMKHVFRAQIKRWTMAIDEKTKIQLPKAQGKNVSGCACVPAPCVPACA